MRLRRPHPPELRAPTVHGNRVIALGTAALLACAAYLAAFELLPRLAAEANWRLAPAERAIEPRHALVGTAPPGGEWIIVGTYEVLRGDCAAEFRRTTRYRTPTGYSMSTDTHSGTWDVQAEPGSVRRGEWRRPVPIDAAPGALAEDHVIGDWQCFTGWPWSYRTIKRVDYGTVELRVAHEPR